MQQYYLIEWPESREFIGNKDCIQAEGMAFFVPCELWDKRETVNKNKV